MDKKEIIDIEDIYDLINYVGPYLQKGIEFNGMKKPFTSLDYYSLTNIDVNNMIKIIKGIKPRTYEEGVNKGFFLSFCNVDITNTSFPLSVDEIDKQRNCFYVNNQKVESTREDVEEVFAFLDEHNIPKLSRNVYTALNRKLTNFPILPLVREEKNKTK